MFTLLQKKILGAGMAFLILLACYVPWTYTVTGLHGFHREKPAGYRFIFDPPQPEKDVISHGVKVDTPRVIIPMVIVIFVTIAAVVLAGRGHHGKGNQGQSSCPDNIKVDQPPAKPSHSPFPIQHSPQVSTERTESSDGPSVARRYSPMVPGTSADDLTIAPQLTNEPQLTPASPSEPRRKDGCDERDEWAEERQASAADSQPVRDTQIPPKEPDNSIAWVLITIGIFVFVATHAFDFAVMSEVVLFGCMCWGTVFGLPAYLCFRYRKRLGGIVVAALFCAAAVLNAASLHERSRLLQSHVNAPRQGKDLSNRPAELTPQRVLPDSDGPIARAAAHVPAPERTASAKMNPAHAYPAEGSRSNASADYFKEGLAAAEAGDYIKAIENYTEAIRLDPRNANYHFFRGCARYKQENLILAIISYDEAIRLEPKHADWYFHRGVAWSQMKEQVKAQKDFDEAQRLDPKTYK